MPCWQGLYKRWPAGGPGSRALWVELAKMLDVPGVAHWNGIFGLQADCAGPGDSCYPIRAFPLQRQPVGILGRLNVPKNKVAFLKAPGNRALGVKLAKKFNIPGIAHRNAIFGLQADCAGPGDSYYPIGPFPLWHQLV